MTFLFNFSFKKITANTVTNKNIVLCIKDADAPEVNCKPLKNNMNGIEPPTRPIKTNFNQSFFLSKLNSLNRVVKNNRENKNRATVMFFANVNIVEFIPETANLFIKIEIPLIIAVENNNNIADFLFIL